MKTYIAVFAALLAASTSSLLSAPAMASEGCSTVAQCLGHDSSSARSDRSNDDNGMGHTERNERNGNDDNGRGENDHGAGHDSGNDSDHGGGHDGGSDHNGGSDNDD